MATDQLDRANALAARIYARLEDPADPARRRLEELVADLAPGVAIDDLDRLAGDVAQPIADAAYAAVRAAREAVTAPIPAPVPARQIVAAR